MLSDVSPKDLETVKQILFQLVPAYDVYAFGSRVSGKNRAASDLDLVIMNEKRLEPTLQANLKELFSESNLPFKVDIVEWATTKENFRKIISQNKIKIQTAVAV